MMSEALQLILEILAVLSVVSFIHALRRKTSLVLCYAVLSFTTFASWVTPHDAVVRVAFLDFHIESSIFFTATLIGVFLLYVVDGSREGRMGLVVVVASGLLYSVLAVLLRAHLGDPGEPGGSPFPLPSPRAILASILASGIDLVLLGILWESSHKGAPWLRLFGRVFVTLLGVLLIDALIYVPAAWGGGPSFESTLAASLLTRGILAAIYAPMVTLYLVYEIRRYGLVLPPRPVLSILTKEDMERELVTAHHNLRLGTEALWESEERYRRMVDDIPLMVFRFSVEGVVTYANRALCKYYERDERDVFGQSLLLPVDRKERDSVWRAIKALNLQQPTAEFVVHVYPRPGDRRVQRWVVRSIFSSSGQALAYQGIGEDITEQWDRERTVKRLQAAIAQTSECVLITDTTGRVAFVNPACEASGILPPGVAVGTDVREVLEPWQREDSVLPLIAAMKERQSWSGRVQLPDNRGSRRTYELVMTPLVDDAADASGYLGIARDVSQQVQIESTLQQVQRMEAMTQVAAGVAHDFNNLLMVVTACNDIAIDELQSRPGDGLDKVIGKLEDACRSATQAAQLNQQLMSLGRREPTEPRPSSLNEIVSETLPLLRSAVPRTIKIETQIEDALPPVLVDPVQVERVAMNLVVNARDAMPSGGTVTLATRVEHLSEHYVLTHPDARPGDHAVLMVSDTGDGMEEKTCHRIFEPFFTTKEGRGGTGLGLSVVYGIAQQAGGHVRVESTPGAGSTFWIYFPTLSEDADWSQRNV